MHLKTLTPGQHMQFKIFDGYGSFSSSLNPIKAICDVELDVEYARFCKEWLPTVPTDSKFDRNRVEHMLTAFSLWLRDQGKVEIVDPCTVMFHQGATIKPEDFCEVYNG